MTHFKLYTMLVVVAVCIANTDWVAANEVNNETAPAPNHEVTETLVKYDLGQNEYKAAEAKLKAQLEKYPHDAQFWRDLGDLRSHVKDFEGARKAYLTASQYAQGTEAAEDLYSVVDMEARLGRKDAAEHTLREFGRKFNEDYAEELIRNLGVGTLPLFEKSKVESVSQPTTEKHLRMTATMSVGYDSNVVLLPDSGSGIKPGSVYLTPSAQIVYGSSVAGSPIQVFGLFGYVYNTNSAASSFNNLPLSVGAEWYLPGNLGSVYRISIIEEADLVFLNSSAFSLFSGSDTLTLKKELVYGEKNSLSMLVPVGYIGYPGISVAGENVRSGFNAGLGFLNRHQSGSLAFSESLVYGHHFADGTNFRDNSIGVSGSIGFPVIDHVNANINALFDHTSYPDNVLGRVDNLYNFGVQLVRSFNAANTIKASLSYAHEKNESNVAEAQYTKDIYMTKVSYDF